MRASKPSKTIYYCMREPEQSDHGSLQSLNSDLILKSNAGRGSAHEQMPSRHPLLRTGQPHLTNKIEWCWTSTPRRLSRDSSTWSYCIYGVHACIVTSCHYLYIPRKCFFFFEPLKLIMQPCFSPIATCTGRKWYWIAFRSASSFATGRSRVVLTSCGSVI